MSVNLYLYNEDGNKFSYIIINIESHAYTSSVKFVAANNKVRVHFIKLHVVSNKITVASMFLHYGRHL